MIEYKQKTEFGEKMNLSELILYLTQKNNLMINFHDTSGVLSIDRLKIDAKFRMHSKAFCDTAKTTHQGYRLCTRAKSLACKKAISLGAHFFGVCPYGLYELVYPIFMNSKLVCILFVGNCLKELESSELKANRACRVTGVNTNDVCVQFKSAEPADENYMLQTAKIIENFMVSVLKEEHLPVKATNGQHWAISEIQLYLNTHFRQKVTLKELAKLYFLNEKYAGRLFLKQTGCTFHKYLSDLRLSYAESLLKSGRKSILDIALESGFNSISYFNRCFYEKHSMTPSDYRRAFTDFK